MLHAKKWIKKIFKYIITNFFEQILKIGYRKPPTLLFILANSFLLSWLKNLTSFIMF